MPSVGHTRKVLMTVKELHEQLEKHLDTCGDAQVVFNGFDRSGFDEQLSEVDENEDEGGFYRTPGRLWINIRIID